MKIIKGKEKEYKDWLDKNNDPFGRRCFTYAEDWANMLEELIDNSEETPFEVISKNAKDTSHKADYDGITGFMYGIAISILSQCWKYGEELKKWNNSEKGEK